MEILASFHAFSSAYAQSDMLGKWILWGLFALSCLGWFVIGCKLWQRRCVQKETIAFQRYVTKHVDHLLRIESSTSHPFAHLYQAFQTKTLVILQKKRYLLQRMGKTKEATLSMDDLALLEQHIQVTISQETKQLERHLFILSTIVTLAPFLGLLGTVWGILVTFSELHLGSAAAGANAAILGGISTALATTVLGLVIAIPALIAYNFLRHFLKTFTSDMEDFVSFLISRLELQYRELE